MTTVTAIIPPPAPEVLKFSGHTNGIASFVLPYVMLWDPLHQLPGLFTNGASCPQCSQQLNETVYWKWGQSSGVQPRTIHCIEYTVLIVSAVYSCACKHTVVASDPRILSTLTFEQQPFVLFHRTGFTKHFINTVINLLREGMTLTRIELYVAKCRKDYGSSLHLRMKLLGNDLLDIASVLNYIQSPAPSNDMICKCFIAHFLEHQTLYDLQMQLLTADQHISFDHTFKIASNIGFQRADHKWVTQYNSVFLVMNEVGQVIAWQLTRSTSLDEVEFLLTNLAIRLSTHGASSRLSVYVDNCCQLRCKLTAIMGSNILVKLDLFHAVQRITRTLSKKHPFFYQCMADLKLVFRQASDLGSTRMLSTPESTVMDSNLDHFLRKWKKCTSGEWRIVTDNTEKEVSSLKKHISKECLSGIPKGAGTNRNEAF